MLPEDVIKRIIGLLPFEDRCRLACTGSYMNALERRVPVSQLPLDLFGTDEEKRALRVIEGSDTFIDPDPTVFVWARRLDKLLQARDGTLVEKVVVDRMGLFIWCMHALGELLLAPQIEVTRELILDARHYQALSTENGFMLGFCPAGEANVPNSSRGPRVRRIHIVEHYDRYLSSDDGAWEWIKSVLAAVGPADVCVTFTPGPNYEGDEEDGDDDFLLAGDALIKYLTDSAAGTRVRMLQLSLLQPDYVAAVWEFRLNDWRPGWEARARGVEELNE